MRPNSRFLSIGLSQHLNNISGAREQYRTFYCRSSVRCVRKRCEKLAPENRSFKRIRNGHINGMEFHIDTEARIIISFFVCVSLPKSSVNFQNKTIYFSTLNKVY